MGCSRSSNTPVQSSTAVQRSVSPDGSYTALLCNVKGGATVPFFRSVVLRNGNSRGSAQNSVYVTRAKGLGLNHIGWQAPHSLHVEYDAADTEFFEKRFVVGDVEVTYTPLPGSTNTQIPDHETSE